MTATRKPQASNRNDAKTLLSTLKVTTTIGAVSLTLAGWGLLSRVEAIQAAEAAQVAPAGLFSPDPSGLALTSSAASAPVSQADFGQGFGAAATAPTVKALATATTSVPAATPISAAAKAKALAKATTSARNAMPAPTATTRALPTPTTAVPTATPAPTAKFKLDVLQWVQTNSGDPVAIVRDNRGVLWYVWGADVPRIEQGLSPQYQPEPVNRVARTRHS